MIFKQPLWFIKSADFQFFGSILPCCNVVDWSDTHLKFSIFKCLSFKHSPNQGLDNKGGKSLVLLPVLVSENVQQSAKQIFNTRFSQAMLFEVKTVCNNHIWSTMVGK